VLLCPGVNNAGAFLFGRKLNSSGHESVKREACFMYIFVLIFHLQKRKNMANQLAEQIRALIFEKVDFQNDEAESIVDGLVLSGLALEDAADVFVSLAADDVDQTDIAEGVVSLADIFDDVDLSPAQSAKLDTAVEKLLKSGTTEQKAAAKTLFSTALTFGSAAKAGNEFFDTLLATPPPEE